LHTRIPDIMHDDNKRLEDISTKEINVRVQPSFDFKCNDVCFGDPSSNFIGMGFKSSLFLHEVIHEDIYLY